MLNFFKTPPIVCITIETDGKTQSELENEVIKLVENKVSSQLSDIDRTKMTDEEYFEIETLILAEKDKMINQFLRQLKYKADSKEYKVETSGARVEVCLA